MESCPVIPISEINLRAPLALMMNPLLAALQTQTCLNLLPKTAVLKIVIFFNEFLPSLIFAMMNLFDAQ